MIAKLEYTRGALVAATLIFAGGCFSVNTQRWPAPAEALQQPLPRGDLDDYPEGQDEVLVVRHADPVQVRPVGALSGYPLSFYNKRVRMKSGSTVIVSAGGRAEIVWTGGSSIVMFGEGVGVIGSPERGEPNFIFKTVDRAMLLLSPGDQVELVGGSILTGDSGPYVLELVRADVLRARNQSKGPLTVSFREEVFDLNPGNVVDLPLLSAGCDPTAEGFGFENLSGPGFPVAVRGEVERREAGGALVLSATGEHEIRALGVSVHLREGEEVHFSSLGRPHVPPSRVAAEESARSTEAPPEVPESLPETPPETSQDPQGEAPWFH